MDTWKLICLSYAMQLKPNSTCEAFAMAERIHDWLSEDAPIADDETEGPEPIYVILPDEQGTEH
jgi:hypothetical protein